MLVDQSKHSPPPLPGHSSRNNFYQVLPGSRNRAVDEWGSGLPQMTKILGSRPSNEKKYESKGNINSISEINLFVYLFIFCTISSTSQLPWRQATVFLIGGETGFGDTRSPLTGKVCLYFIGRSIKNEKKNLKTIIGHIAVLFQDYISVPQC